MAVLINHFENTTDTIRKEIREESQSCIGQLIKLGQTKHQAKASLAEILKEADKTRKDNKDEAIRRKRQRRERELQQLQRNTLLPREPKLTK